MTDAERDAWQTHYPEATVENVDNAGYEWLDGMEFSDNAEVEKAARMGETAYKEMLEATDQKKINAMLMLEIARLKSKAGVKNE